MENQPTNRNYRLQAVIRDDTLILSIKSEGGNRLFIQTNRDFFSWIKKQFVSKVESE